MMASVMYKRLLLSLGWHVGYPVLAIIRRPSGIFLNEEELLRERRPKQDLR